MRPNVSTMKDRILSGLHHTVGEIGIRETDPLKFEVKEDVYGGMQRDLQHGKDEKDHQDCYQRKVQKPHRAAVT